MILFATALPLSALIAILMLQTRQVTYLVNLAFAVYGK